MIAKKKYYFNLLIRVLKRLIYGLFDNFLKNTTGIIHIGANIGQEKDHYKKYKIKNTINRTADISFEFKIFNTFFILYKCDFIYL